MPVQDPHPPPDANSTPLDTIESAAHAWLRAHPGKLVPRLILVLVALSRPRPRRR